MTLGACGGNDEESPADGGTGGSGAGGSGGGFYVAGGVGSGTGDGDGDIEDEPGLSVCVLDGMETTPEEAGGTLIDDLDDGNGRHRGNGTIGYWLGNDDGSAGQQVPPSPGPDNPYAALSNDAPVPGGVTDDGFALHVVGSGFTAWGQTIGLLLAASSEEVEDQCAFDASDYEGFSFWLKGSIVSTRDGSPGVLSVQALESDVVPFDLGGECDPLGLPCWDGHDVEVVPTECWRRVVVRFDDMRPDGWGLPPGELDRNELSAITFGVAQNMEYDYWLDEVSFFGATAPEEEERCDESALGGAGGLGAQ